MVIYKLVQIIFAGLLRSLGLFYIGVGRFRILGGQGLEYWGAKGRAEFPAGT